MDPVDRHAFSADVSFDGGNLDCGSGLLLLIRKHIDPMKRGQILEIRSTESSVEEDLPAWCRLTGNALLSWTRQGAARSFLVCKGSLEERSAGPAAAQHVSAPRALAAGPEIISQPMPAPDVPALAVMGIGSWPRPRWMVQAIHEHMEGRLGEVEFQSTADDAVRLAVEAQLRAGVDVVTDGEQRRDSYASFVGGILDNCQLIPLTDLLPLVDDPEKFRDELKALDVPAGEVRHPAVLGPLGRSRPLALHELRFVQSITNKPVKVALPGPYLLTRTMWMECISDRAYTSREHLAQDVVRILREEAEALLAGGAALVQFDEPVLSEVVFGGPKKARTFMCGALGEKRGTDEELAFARDLINGVVQSLPPRRTAMHICRGNWTRDESAALSGDYRPLLPLLKELRVGTFFLELCTPRAGDVEILRALPDNCRIGVGVVNQKHDRIETVEEIVGKARHAVALFGADRVFLNPDCGFATFADNPVASAAIAEAKLASIAQAARIVRGYEP